MATPRTNPRGKPFQKGVSGNPGGRPKGVAEVADLAKTHSTGAVETLASIMTDTSVDPRARVAAASSILDRACGKPRMAVDVTDATPRAFQIITPLTKGLPLIASPETSR